jgi:hypothetical protein
MGAPTLEACGPEQLCLSLEPEWSKLVMKLYPPLQLLVHLNLFSKFANKSISACEFVT